MAVSYALFGVSRVSAKLPALLGSLALIGTTWLLAREVAGRTAAWFAAAFAALPASVRPRAVVKTVGALHGGHPVRLAVPHLRRPAGLAAGGPARRPLELRLRRRRRAGAVDASAGGLVPGCGRADACGARPRRTLAADRRLGAGRLRPGRAADLDLQPADRRGDVPVRAGRHAGPDRRPRRGPGRVVEQRPAARGRAVAPVGRQLELAWSAHRPCRVWRARMGLPSDAVG